MPLAQVKKRRISSAGLSGCKIAEVECKSALVRSRIEGTDYALNPYIGCQHGCVYCYAEFMKKYTNHSEEWGTFVDAKINIPDRLAEQVKRTKPGVVQLSTVTDAYQPVEKEFCLTRRCLEILADFDFPITVQTKSDLVLRDMDILKRIKDKDIGFTITCPDPKMEKIFEPGASSLDARLEALKKLQENDIPTFVFVGPVLPYFSDSIQALRSLFGKLKEIGINRIYVDRMNYLKGKRKRIASVLKNQFPDVLRLYEGVTKREEEYTEWLKGNLASALSGFSFDSEVLF